MKHSVMNTRDVLNAYLYPGIYENTRRKDFPYYDELDLVTGTLEYFFFTTALGDQFLRNKRLPLAGSEVFFIEEISMILLNNMNTVGKVDSLNEMLQQSFLQISVDNRVVCKLPGMDFIQIIYEDQLVDQVPVAYENPHVYSAQRKLPLPIILNSTSAFEFKFVTTAAAATTFNGQEIRLTLHGLQLDKLDSFYWDNLKNNQFQQVPVTYYQTVVIPDGTEQTFQLFADASDSPNLFSKTFPLSDITTMAIQNIEVLFNQPDVPIRPFDIYESRLRNVLKINVDDVVYFDSSLMNMLSVVAGIAQVLTTTPDLDTLVVWVERNSYTLRVPLNIPANSKVTMSLTQPASSVGITGEFTVALRGVETRRVA